MAITRTAFTDDDGSGTTGTVINNAVKTELYDQIDAADAALGAPNNLAYDLLPDADGTRKLGSAAKSWDGSEIILLSATNLGSGTVPDARFPTTLPAASGVNLTALNGSAVASGSVADARIAAILTGKQITPRLQSVASAATVTPAPDTEDLVVITAQAAALTLANPTPVANVTQGQRLQVRVTDNGTARAITYGTKYRATGLALPATTVISTVLFLTFHYNVADDKWDLTGTSVMTSAAAGGEEFLIDVVGTTTNASAETIALCTLTNLTAKDRLKVIVELEAVTAGVALPTLYHSTDALAIANLNNASNMSAGMQVLGETILAQAQNSATRVLGYARNFQYVGAGNYNAIASWFLDTTLTTAWTAASWDLGFRHGGVTATGTLRYHIRVSKLPGQ